MSKTSEITGTIRVYLGCMFSGKTSEIIREYTRWNKINKSAICINFDADNRYGEDDYVYSHDLNKIGCIKTNKLMELDENIIQSHDVILINEGQFFDDLIDFCQLWCDRYNKHIVVCGLDGDYLRKPFGQMNQLISIADEVTKLKAFCVKCNDGTHAIFTWRLSNDSNQISIGNDYIPVCRKHYIELQDYKNDNNIVEFASK